MHYARIVLPGEDVPGASHVGSELIHGFCVAYHCGCNLRIAEVADPELIGRRCGELMFFEIDPADPETFALQPLHQMTADEAAGSAYCNCRHRALAPM